MGFRELKLDFVLINACPVSGTCSMYLCVDEAARQITMIDISEVECLKHDLHKICCLSHNQRSPKLPRDSAYHVLALSTSFSTFSSANMGLRLSDLQN